MEYSPFILFGESHAESQINWERRDGKQGFPTHSSHDEFNPKQVIEVQGRFLFNGKVAYEVWKGVKPFVMVENIFDSSYEAIRGYPRPGRRFFLGINAKFDSLKIFG